MRPDERAQLFAESLDLLVDGADSAARAAPGVGEALSAQEVRVIQAVGRHECCPMNVIARAIRLSLSSVTGLIDRLCEKKLVKRDRSSEDRRVVEVELTEAGSHMRAAALKGRLAFAREALGALSAEEQESLVQLMSKVAKTPR